MLFDYGTAQVRAVRQAIKNAWPEVLTPQPPHPVEGGIWEMSQSKHVAYESLSFPRAHIQWPVAEPWNDGPMNVIIYEQPCIVYYVAETDGGDTSPFRTQTGLLEHVIKANGLVDPTTGAEFTVLPNRFMLHFYANSEVQEIMFIRNQYAMAGGLAIAFLTGDDGR